ncbi:MAG TPA: thermonuclease family protein [Solirubrobacteraceae bacterium]|jgi:micrococcal nuclease
MRRIVLLVVLLALGSAYGVGRRGTDGSAAQDGRVTRVVDGDTIVVGDERVRLIGVDTPESVKPGTPVECFAREASAFVKKLLTGRNVRLELDVEKRDRYGRLLAYVYRDDLFVNAELVRRGYASVATFPPNVRHVDEFVRLQREARGASRGLWRAC